MMQTVKICKKERNVFACLPVFISLVLLITASGCTGRSVSNNRSAASDGVTEMTTSTDQANAGSSIPAAAPTEKQVPVPDGFKPYYVPELKGAVSAPSDYYVFGKNIDYSDDMCYAVGLDPERMKTYFSLSFDSVVMIPSGDRFFDPSFEIKLKVKSNKYPGIDFAGMSEQEFRSYAESFIRDFQTDHTTLEKNGLRFIVFDWDGPETKSFRYATIIDGDMIYVYATSADQTLTPQQREILESIAVSIRREQ